VIAASGRPTAALPRAALGRFPTPLEPAPRLSAVLGGPPIWIKREDLSGLALGGNKPRQLEFLLGDAVADGVQAVVTTAAAQSNFCRTCAAAGARLGLKVGLLLRGQADASVQGNLLLDHVFGAEVRFIETTDPYDPRVPGWMDEMVKDFERRGLKTRVLHIPGESGTLGAAAMVDVGYELAEQFREVGIAPQALHLAAGSALTTAGVALAFKSLGLATRVVGVSVQRPASFIAPLAAQRANAAATLLGLPVTVTVHDFEIDDRFIGPAYGVPTPQAIDAIALAGRTEALVLDPVYTGKAFAALAAQVRGGRWHGDAPLVFFHSGGTPGLFVHAQSVADGVLP
jgi:1-aminocyclopropane-1-carboxylate deaminase/D-cysteine desulfhydrase-like pyridoxal-dependent ACC family enzyme